MSERMLFCLGNGKYKSNGEGYQKNNRVFNIQVTKDEFDKIKFNVPNIKLPITRWIEEKEMTNEEKETNENYKTLGGYLKTLSYKYAWKLAWSEMDKETKNKFLSIPHFDNKIFKEITGIEVENEPGLSGKEVTVTLDGKSYTAVIKLRKETMKTQTEQCLCQSYYDNNDILQNCTCGKCSVKKYSKVFPEY